MSNYSPTRRPEQGRRADVVPEVLRGKINGTKARGGMVLDISVIESVELVAKKVIAKNFSRVGPQFHLSKDELMDDLITHGYRVVSKFDETKKVKMTTFLYTCLERRMADQVKMSRRKKRNAVRVDSDVEECAGSFSENDPFVGLDFKISMARLLNTREQIVMAMLTDGASRAEIGDYIAEIDGLSASFGVREVENHVKRITFKLRDNGLLPEGFDVLPTPGGTNDQKERASELRPCGTSGGSEARKRFTRGAHRGRPTLEGICVARKDEEIEREDTPPVGAGRASEERA